MRLYATLAVTAAAIALTFNFCPTSSETAGPVIIDDVRPVVADVTIVAEADDDLTLMLRQQARTAMLELQQRQAQF